MNNIGVIDIKRAYASLDYPLFEDDSKPFNVNLIGVRSADNTPRHQQVSEGEICAPIIDWGAKGWGETAQQVDKTV